MNGTRLLVFSYFLICIKLSFTLEHNCYQRTVSNFLTYPNFGVFSILASVPKMTLRLHKTVCGLQNIGKIQSNTPIFCDPI